METQSTSLTAHDEILCAAPHPVPQLRDHLLPNAEKGHLPPATVEHLHRLLGGEARVEAMVLRFIADMYQAESLLNLSPTVASQIIKRPGDFLGAVKQHCEPELFAEGHQF